MRGIPVLDSTLLLIAGLGELQLRNLVDIKKGGHAAAALLGFFLDKI